MVVGVGVAGDNRCTQAARKAARNQGGSNRILEAPLVVGVRREVDHILRTSVNPRAFREPSNGQELPCEWRASDSSIIWSKMDRALTNVSFIVTKSAGFKVLSGSDAIKQATNLAFDCTCQ